jgi:uncharacterized protein
MPPQYPAAHKIAEKIAAEIGCHPRQVLAAAALLDEGATVPFIARYRKEITGGLDDIQLRLLDERLLYLREMEERRRVILASIEDQGKLTPELATAIHAAETKQGLEDLYLPYKPKRRSKAQIAREAGLAPLAAALLADPMRSPAAEAAHYLNAEAGFADVRSVLDGARQILMEQFSEDAGLLGELRSHLEARFREVDGPRRQGKRGGQVPGLFCLHGSDPGDSLASCAGALPRPQRRHAATGAGPRQRA